MGRPVRVRLGRQDRLGRQAKLASEFADRTVEHIDGPGELPGLHPVMRKRPPHPLTGSGGAGLLH
jgi:hypothetical protein